MQAVTPLNYERYTVVVGLVPPLGIGGVAASNALAAVKVTPKRTDFNLPHKQAFVTAPLRHILKASQPVGAPPKLTSSGPPSQLNASNVLISSDQDNAPAVLPQVVAGLYEKTLSIL